MKGGMSNESNVSQDDVLDRILVFLTIFLSLEFALQIIIFIRSESPVSYLIVNSFLYASLMITILVRKKIDARSKVLILSFISIGISVIGLLHNGLNGINYAIVALMIILAFFIPRKFLYAIATFTFILYASIAYAFITGLTKPVNDLNQLNGFPGPLVDNTCVNFWIDTFFIFKFW